MIYWGGSLLLSLVLLSLVSLRADYRALSSLIVTRPSAHARTLWEKKLLSWHDSLPFLHGVKMICGEISYRVSLTRRPEYFYPIKMVVGS